MRENRSFAGVIWWGLVAFCLLSAAGFPAAFASAPQNQPCPRFAEGSVVHQARNIFSSNGLLAVTFTYRTRVDENGFTLFCFTDETGSQSPTLRVHPGDRVLLTLKNELPPSMAKMQMDFMPAMTPDKRYSRCGSSPMNGSSVNLHYHGTNLSPACGQDEVIRTLVDAGGNYTYDLHFPTDEPPGLYWYHPHVHGMAEPAVQGGATGAIVVEGIENAIPEAAGLPERILLFRDTPCTAVSTDPDEPTYDLSVNYTPVTFPKYTPAVLPMKPKERQFWRVANTSADAILDLQLLYDGVAQPLKIVALDGVPTGTHDGTGRGSPIEENHIFLSPASRAEFIVTGPRRDVKTASLITSTIDTGPDGDSDPVRRLVVIPTLGSMADSNTEPLYTLPTAVSLPTPPRFEGLATAPVTAHRKLYFSEVLTDPSNADSPTNFYITVDGAKPELFDPNNPPAIVTTQGSVEDWTIENRAMEVHEFHIHQIHFLLLEQNNQVVSNGQYYDTMNVPYWSGTGPYPSIKVRMDFRGPTVGDFVYHCHILGHEDGGMMAIIRVNPKPN